MTDSDDDLQPLPTHEGDAHYYADLSRGKEGKRLFEAVSSTGYGSELKEPQEIPYQSLPAESTAKLEITRRGPYKDVTSSKYGVEDCKYRCVH